MTLARLKRQAQLCWLSAAQKAGPGAVQQFLEGARLASSSPLTEMHELMEHFLMIISCWHRACETIASKITPRMIRGKHWCLDLQAGHERSLRSGKSPQSSKESCFGTNPRPPSVAMQRWRPHGTRPWARQGASFGCERFPETSTFNISIAFQAARKQSENSPSID